MKYAAVFRTAMIMACCFGHPAQADIAKANAALGAISGLIDSQRSGIDPALLRVQQTYELSVKILEDIEGLEDAILGLFQEAEVTRASTLQSIKESFETQAVHNVFTELETYLKERAVYQGVLASKHSSDDISAHEAKLISLAESQAIEISRSRIALRQQSGLVAPIVASSLLGEIDARIHANQAAGLETVFAWFSDYAELQDDQQIPHTLAFEISLLRGKLEARTAELDKMIGQHFGAGMSSSNLQDGTYQVDCSDHMISTRIFVPRKGTVPRPNFSANFVSETVVTRIYRDHGLTSISLSEPRFSLVPFTVAPAGMTRGELQAFSKEENLQYCKKNFGSSDNQILGPNNQPFVLAFDDIAMKILVIEKTQEALIFLLSLQKSFHQAVEMIDDLKVTLETKGPLAFRPTPEELRNVLAIDKIARERFRQSISSLDHTLSFQRFSYFKDEARMRRVETAEILRSHEDELSAAFEAVSRNEGIETMLGQIQLFSTALVVGTALETTLSVAKAVGNSDQLSEDDVGSEINGTANVAGKERTENEQTEDMRLETEIDDRIAALDSVTQRALKGSVTDTVYVLKKGITEFDKLPRSDIAAREAKILELAELAYGSSSSQSLKWKLEKVSYPFDARTPYEVYDTIRNAGLVTAIGLFQTVLFFGSEISTSGEVDFYADFDELNGEITSRWESVIKAKNPELSNSLSTLKKELRNDRIWTECSKAPCWKARR